MIDIMDYMVQAEKQKGERLLLTIRSKTRPDEIFSCKVIRTDAAFIEEDLGAAMTDLITDWIRTSANRKQRPLSKSVKKSYTALCSLWRKNGMAPTMDEIAAEVGLRYRATVHYHLIRMVQCGWVYKDTNGKYVPIDIIL